MTIENFATELMKAAPSESDLKRLGLSNEEVQRASNRYLCVKRDRPLSQPSGSDLVLELLRNWDLSKVEIGMVRFPVPPAELSGNICIGCVEDDPLVLLSNGGEIVVHELGTKEHLLWRVAKSGSTFIDALILAARFLSRRGVGTIAFDDYVTAQSVAAQCSSAAGGDEFGGFYTMLLGAAA